LRPHAAENRETAGNSQINRARGQHQQNKKCLSINPGSRQGIHIEGQAIEDVDNFTYLGSIVSKTEGTEEDIKARIGKARHAFVTMRPVWNNRNIHWKTKIRLFNTIARQSSFMALKPGKGLDAWTRVCKHSSTNVLGRS
jgi:hypothetical protein